MNDQIAYALLKFIAQNMQTESRFLSPQPQTNIEVVALLDEIADLRGIDRRDNGQQFNDICDKLSITK